MPLQENEERLFAALEIKDQETRLKEMKSVISELSGEDNINCKNRRGHTPLWIAIEKNDLEALKLLVEENADVNDKNIYGYTALMVAIKKNHNLCAQYLIQMNADINSRTHLLDKENNISVWELAVQCENFQIVKLLLQKKVAMTIIHSVIHHIFQKKDYDLLKVLLTNYPNQNMVDRTFEGAAYYGDADIISKYIHLVSMTLIHRALEYASDIPHFEVIQKIKSHVPLCYEDLMYFTKAAIRDNNIPFMQSITDQEWEPLNKNELFIYAAKYRSFHILDKLLDAKVDVNAKSNDNQTALTTAIEAGDIECIAFLLEKKADLNANVNGIFPMIYAIKNNDEKCVKFLLEHKANPNADDKYNNQLIRFYERNDAMCNKLPIHAAFIKGDLAIISLLMEYKASLNYSRIDKTITSVVELGRVECLEYLLDMKANVKNLSQDFKIKPGVNVVKFAECVSIVKDVCVEHQPVKTKFLDSIFKAKFPTLKKEEVEYIPLQRLSI